ncbi:RNA-binding protein squid isoform X2 [Contarinia nasturtii]|uniref:RNA-binding protein squid isoform X2 n=1 Tax=Contarinia nasturtii TaxID=265458 RepID=UPI0012D3835A|nr:RNA-binding protein squid isoform X2 [Contarinia nasturtii]
MANNQDLQEDFSQDVKDDQHFNGDEAGENGTDNGTENGNENGNDGAQLNENEQGQQGGEAASGRDDDRKLFVGGLSWETTEKELREHFGQYGEIESINVKTDPQTGRSRGFAFIVYTSPEAIEKVTAVAEHVINNKKVDPKKAKARHGKIFVGGLTSEISDEEIKTFFGQFGNIVEVEMPFDKQKNQRKAFCFITFDSEQVVNELLKTPKQTISGKEVDVKKATPKPDNVPGQFGVGGSRGGPRGRQVRGGFGGPKGWNQSYGYGGQGSSYYGPNYDGYAGYADYYSGGYGAGSYGAGYQDYYSGNYDYGYGGADYTNYGGSRQGRGMGGNYQGGKQQRGGGGRQPRHQPY